MYSYVCDRVYKMHVIFNCTMSKNFPCELAKNTKLSKYIINLWCFAYIVSFCQIYGPIAYLQTEICTVQLNSKLTLECRDS